MVSASSHSSEKFVKIIRYRLIGCCKHVFLSFSCVGCIIQILLCVVNTVRLSQDTPIQSAFSTQ
jgi:hypothetical protein